MQVRRQVGKKRRSRRRRTAAARSGPGRSAGKKPGHTIGKYRRELKEVLEQQAATAEVLRVISSSPGELEPVFQAMLENAIRICEANFGNLFLYERGAFRIVSTKNAPPAFAEQVRHSSGLVVDERSRVPLARLARIKQVIHIGSHHRSRIPGWRSPPRFTCRLRGTDDAACPNAPGKSACWRNCHLPT